MNLNVKDLCGPHLLNHELCCKIEDAVTLSTLSGDLEIVLSFEGIESISPTFANVFMTYVLQMERKYPLIHVLLQDLRPRLQAVLEKSREASLGFC